MRVTKLIKIGERVKWQVFGEVFNLLNTANLSGYEDNLLAPGFGQPTATFSSIFGTGRPKVFPVGDAAEFLDPHILGLPSRYRGHLAEPNRTAYPARATK